MAAEMKVFGFDWHHRDDPWSNAPVWAKELAVVLHRVHDNQETIMAQVDDLNAALKTLAAEVAEDEAAMTAAGGLLDQLHGMIGGIATSPDLTSAIAAATDAQTALAVARATLTARTTADQPGPAPATGSRF